MNNYCCENFTSSEQEQEAIKWIIECGGIELNQHHRPQKKCRIHRLKDSIQSNKYKYRMICFPWAGGNSMACNYRKWKITNVHILAIELPTRLGRLREAPITDIHILIELRPEIAESQNFVNLKKTFVKLT